MRRMILGLVLGVAALVSMSGTASAQYGYYRHPYRGCPYGGYYQPYGVYYRPYGPYPRPYVAPPWGWGYGPGIGMGVGVY